MQSSAEYPSVVLALFVEQLTPFLEEFFERIVELDYPKERIDLLVHTQVLPVVLPIAESSNPDPSGWIIVIYVLAG